MKLLKTIIKSITALFVIFSCQNQMDSAINPNSNNEENEDDNLFFYYEGDEYALKEINNKLFLQFSPSTPYNVDWDKWSVDYETWNNLIIDYPTLQKYEVNYDFLETGQSSTVPSDTRLLWGNYAFLESKDGKTIEQATIDYFLSNPVVGSVSFPFEAPAELGYIGVLQGLRNEFVVKLKETTSFDQFQLLADQNSCTISNEDSHVKNQFFVNVPKTSNLNAIQMSKLFYETDLFESVQPSFVLINLWNSSFEDKRIVKIYEDEPAIVQKTCFEHVGRKEAFYFDFVNHSELHSQSVFPIATIPEQFRKEGLSVKISGNVTNCLVAGGCIEPNFRMAPINLFEIKSIKINK